MLKDKALENLAAADELLEAGRCNAAASRYYYAMFQAAVARLEATGRHADAFRSGADRWEHAMIANNASLLRGRRTDRALYHEVMVLRHQADYAHEAVSSSELTRCRADVREFVRGLT